ncbi:MAG: PAS domain S-box protein [Burkholderiales bacterium]|jgi:PAS domain S-box-containing protein
MSDAEFKLHQAIVEQAPDAIIFADRAGAIRIWNRAAETVFGYAAAEVLGGRLDVIIPERLRSAHWDGFHRALDSGQTKLGAKALTTRSVHKNGSKLYVELSFSLIRNADGVIVGALAVGRDCSARYLEERALRARVTQLEEHAKAGRNEKL